MAVTFLGGQPTVTAMVEANGGSGRGPAFGPSPPRTWAVGLRSVVSGSRPPDVTVPRPARRAGSVHRAGLVVQDPVGWS